MRWKDLLWITAGAPHGSLLRTQFPTSAGVTAWAAASLCSFQFQSIDDIISGESTCQSTSYSSRCAAPTSLLHSELGVRTRFNGLRPFLKSICESTGKQIQNVWERWTIRHKTDCNSLNFDLICVKCVFFIHYKTLNMIPDAALELNTVTGWNWRDTQTFTRMSGSRPAVCLSDAAVASCQRQKTSHAATHKGSRQCSFHLNTFEAVSEYISKRSVFGGSRGQDIKTRGDLAENKITADHFFKSN